MGVVIEAVALVLGSLELRTLLATASSAASRPSPPSPWISSHLMQRGETAWRSPTSRPPSSCLLLAVYAGLGATSIALA